MPPPIPRHLSSVCFVCNLGYRRPWYHYVNETLLSSPDVLVLPLVYLCALDGDAAAAVAAACVFQVQTQDLRY